ncbi:hypothetical protein MJO28_010713 [Puccinia striiformis f. sp. tritici]|uniref:Uncharacterized protein n=1 Tax=Puccinia striiformis f. sp. tritici TaxID=168172 RepID=A0ACC0E786_9BASI|nr:hypothetical protein MJO28_010713 [Puccinia striiformis f. sp. tritici]
MTLPFPEVLADPRTNRLLGHLVSLLQQQSTTTSADTDSSDTNHSSMPVHPSQPVKRPNETSDEVQHDVNLNDASINLGSTKNKRRQAWRRGQSGKAYASQISPHGLDCRPYYRNAKNVGFELYPDIPQINKHYTRKPTPGELAAAYISVSQPGWKLFDKGLNIMFDDDTKDSRIIAIVEFVEWAEMSDELKEEVNYVSEFLVESKQFVNPVPTRGWGGSMWALGWRKAMVKGEIIGRYIKQVAVNAAPALFHRLFDSSSWVASILGKMFKNMGSVPFKNNQEIMKTNGIPDFADLMFTNSNTKVTGSPHLTYTTNGFYNPPHEDKKDKSDFAFVMFVPTIKATGRLAGPSDDGTHTGTTIGDNDQYLTKAVNKGTA